MSAKSTKGVNISLTSSTATQSAVPIKSITAGTGKSVEVVVTATTAPNIGDTVKFGQTGYSSLTSKLLVITKVAPVGTPPADAVSADAVSADVRVGSDYKLTFGNVGLGNGVFNTSATLDLFSQVEDVCLCLNSFSITKDTPSSISVGTFCDPSASLPSTSTTAGSVSFGGYIDVAEPDYPLLIEAEADGIARNMKVTFPAGQGYIVFPVIISSIVYDIPLDGGLGYTGTGTLTSNAIHCF
jgi:hypothetical protein